MLKHGLILILIISLSGLANLCFGQAQIGQRNPSLIRLDKLYHGTLKDVLADIAKQYNLEIDLQSARAEKIEILERYFSTPLDEMLRTVTKANKLYLNILPDGKIVISDNRLGSNPGQLNVVRNTENMQPSRSGFSLSGIVVDRASGEPLPFAAIWIPGTKIVSTGNADGRFTLLNVPSDTCQIKVRYIGYNIATFYLSPKVALENVTIELDQDEKELNEVTIVNDKQELLSAQTDGVGVLRMVPSKLAYLPNVGERDILRSFQLMPGVSASNESSSGLYVRGGTPDQNLILYDGFTVYHVDHLYGFFSAFNPNGIKDVQLYKGGFESRFGGRLSSVTEITGKDGNRNRFNMGGDLSLLSTNLWAECPIGDKITTLLAVRRSYQGLLYDQLFDKFNSSSTSSNQTQNNNKGGGGGPGFSGQETTASSYFYDLNAKISYRPTQKDIVSLSLYNGTDNLDNSRSTTTPSQLASLGINFDFSTSDKTNYGNIGSSLKWSRMWNQHLYSNTLISFSDYYSERNRTTKGSITNKDGSSRSFNNGIIENNNLRDFTFQSHYTFDLSNRNQVGWGFFKSNYDNIYNYATNDTSRLLDRNNGAGLYGGYFQDKLGIRKLTIMPGLRISNYSGTNLWYYEPRLWATHKVGSYLTLKAATGKYFQFANRVLREDILSGSRDFWILADGKGIPVSQAIHYMGGFSLENEDYLFGTEAYYKQISNLTEYSLRFDPSPQGTTYNENFYTGNGFSQGLEFLFQRKSGKVNGWLSYTLARSRNHFDVYQEGYYPANQDVTHEAKAVGIYKHKRWTFSATFVYATGRPYTSPEAGYTLTLADGTTRDYLTVGRKNALRLPDYHRLDINVLYDLYRDEGAKQLGTIGFSIFNLYDHTNIWYKEFQVVSNTLIATDVKYLGFTPNITLSLKLH